MDGIRDIDQIKARLRAEIPGLQMEQLRASHPGDDDGLWFINAPGSAGEVQVESSGGHCPFLIEGNCVERFAGKDVEEVVGIVRSLLEEGSANGVRWPAT